MSGSCPAYAPCGPAILVAADGRCVRAIQTHGRRPRPATRKLLASRRIAL
jgi:hypothetical protein